MTELRVMKGGEKTWKNIEIKNNVTISNRTNIGEKLSYGEVQAEIYDGEVVTKRNGDGKSEEKLWFNRLSLNEVKHKLFMEIANADGNAKTLSEADVTNVAMAYSQDKLTEMGISKVVKDLANGVIQFFLGDGKNDVLTFDFETKEEKMERTALQVQVGEGVSVMDVANKYGVDPKTVVQDNIDCIDSLKQDQAMELTNIDTDNVESLISAFDGIKFEPGSSIDINLNDNDYSKCFDGSKYKNN